MHICIVFIAYKAYKELESQLKENRSDWHSHLYGKNYNPFNKEEIQQPLIVNDEQRTLLDYSILKKGVPMRKAGKEESFPLGVPKGGLRTCLALKEPVRRNFQQAVHLI